MKSTGIVRRIDDLGRIVIPKEIRKTLKIKEGDPLEILVEQSQVLLKKYMPINSIEGCVVGVSKCLYNETNYSVAIFDSERVVAADGKAKDFLNDTITKEALKIFNEGKSFAISESDNLNPIKLFSSDDFRFKSQLIVPVINKNNETLAVICLLDTDGKTKFGAVEIKLLKLVGEFIKSKIID